MNLTPRWTWLRTAMRAVRPAPPPDAADMGTAFGLEFSGPDLPPLRRGEPAAGATHRVSPLTGLPRRD